MEECETAKQAMNATYRTQEESLKVIERINRRANLTIKVANESTEQLRYQEELLDQDGRDLDHIKVNLDRSEKKLKEINRECCLIL